MRCRLHPLDREPVGPGASPTLEAIDFKQQLLATVAGGLIAIVTGIAVQLITARHQRDHAVASWRRQRADLRADHQRETVVELQMKLRSFRKAVIDQARDDIEPVTDDPLHLQQLWEAEDQLRLVISHVSDAELRRVAAAARAELQKAHGSENPRALASALTNAQPYLDQVDASVTDQLSQL